MQASLLIVDNIATNRVALKVKLTAAWYDVHTASSGEEALAQVCNALPNMIIVNNTLSDMSVAEFCDRLKSLLKQSAPPVLALTEIADAREPLLRSGIEDVLPMPIDDRLLIARIRSVLRATASEAEWRLRDSTTRALGFAEPAQSFDRPVPIAHLHGPGLELLNSRLAGAADRSDLSVESVPLNSAMRSLSQTSDASVVVIELPEDTPENGLSLLSDLRANGKTRHKAILVAVPENRADLAAQALDLGADDATTGVIPAAELVLRAQRLHTRREINESLRATVRNGAEAALRDPLTGLYNRRYAIPHLERIAEQSRQSGRPFAVMIADLDHFKRINDWYGHDAGDAVLTECARRLQQNMRAVDLVARIGGEEFLIVLPATGRAAARQAALRICQRISETPVDLPDGGTSIDVTVSIGLALGTGMSTETSSLETGQSPNDLLARADRALYRAKEMGRNRFMLERSAA